MTGRAALFAGCAILASCATTPLPAPANEARYVPSGELSFLQEEMPADAELIDFSRVGYHYSERAIAYADEAEFAVRDYGAVPDDGIDDTDAIRRAIAAAEKAGGGIVQFESGVYAINARPADGSVIIRGDNIVIRGRGADKTRLRMQEHLEPTDPKRLWTVPPMFEFRGGATIGKRALAAGKTFPAGSSVLELADASGLQQGHYLRFDLSSHAVLDDYLKGKPVRSVWSRIAEKGIELAEIVEVARVDGNRVYLRQPLLTELDAALPWQVKQVDLLEHVGFEKLAFEGGFLDDFVHHKDARHDGGFKAVSLHGTAHSWVREVRFSNVSSAASVNQGLANSILLNVIEGNRGHSVANAQFSTRTLLGLILDQTDKGQFHGANASHMAVGTVIWRFVAPRSRGIDMHAQYPRLTLVDRMRTNGFGGWGGNYTNLPNHLDGLVFWNPSHRELGDQASIRGRLLDFWQLPEKDSDKYGYLTAVDPLVVGYEGPFETINAENAHIVRFGRNVTPASLYETQLRQRLGQTPQWMHDALAQWQEMLPPGYD